MAALEPDHYPGIRGGDLQVADDPDGGVRFTITTGGTGPTAAITLEPDDAQRLLSELAGRWYHQKYRQAATDGTARLT